MKFLTLAVLLPGLFPAPVPGAALVDRIAVVAGKQVIKSSDIDRNVRLTSFINRQPVDFSPTARRKAAERLVDQLIIRQELAAEGYSRASDEDADTMQTQIAKERFQGSAAQMKTALQRYGLTGPDLHEQLLWQLTVLRFIDERFRPGVLVTGEEIQAYYNQHLAEIQKESPNASSLEAVSPKIKTVLEGQRIDAEFEQWLNEARKRNRIEYKEAAFQ